MKSFSDLVITACSSLSPGFSLALGEDSYRTSFTECDLGAGERLAVGRLCGEDESALVKWSQLERELERSDRSVQMSTFLCERAFEQAGWRIDQESERTLVCVGSSRGASELLEGSHSRFLLNQRTRIDTSPSTTLGQLSSFPLARLSFPSLGVGVAMTCSSSGLALMNAVSWITAGTADRALVCGVEACLTPFTLHMLQLLGIYSGLSPVSEPIPCRPFERDAPHGNTFVLGEGGACIAVERKEDAQRRGADILCSLEGIGVGFEKRRGKTAISEAGECLHCAMKQALNRTPPHMVDGVLLHGPGTVVGDRAERQALMDIFGCELPPCYSSKWLFGHTLGASGLLSLAFALWMFQKGKLLNFPYETELEETVRPIHTVLINSAGFGGGASSTLVRFEE
ncbi:MAG: hypothetical protein KDD64_02570 [Bdellovibrionales bacterium]|nr:hypothetical protein [Bdellovibrionales bacterium]